MKCVELNDFRALPSGVLYTFYRYPAMMSLTSSLERLDGLFIKGETQGDCWTFTRVLPDFCGSCDASRLDIVADIRSGGTSPDLDFQEEETMEPSEMPGEIAVLERRDVEGLIDRLQSCLDSYDEKLNFGYPPDVQEITRNFFSGYYD